MAISDKLAFEIYTISIFHITALILLFSFSAYVYFRAKKTPLLYGYMAVVGMIALWMLSKLLKTVAPNEGLRWLFIVTQYFGVDFLGFSLVVFAYIYAKNKVPSKTQLSLWAILPVLSFLAVVTNPLHMSFYSYYDFYKDRFGALFYPAQSVQYIYLLVGIIMLSQGFTKQPGFHGKRGFGVFFAAITLIPLFANLYYILFKMSALPWVFPFPVFDFTPIAGTIALILFMIPALTFRFFDISPISYNRLFEIMPQGVVFVDKKKTLYGGNSAFYAMFELKTESIGLDEFVYRNLEQHADNNDIQSFVSSESKGFELALENGKAYKFEKNTQRNGHILLYFTDITEISKNRNLLSQQNAELNEANRRLDNLAEKTKELAVAKTKMQMAQSVHDILGHSLTVVIGTAELAADDNAQSAREKLSQINELLTSSLNDLRNSALDYENNWGKSSLTSAVEHLKNEKIKVDIAIHGDVYELNSAQTEAVFRLCQEAVTNSIKHSRAKTIYIILRYTPRQLEVFAIDNGTGCGKIVKSYGLSGIEDRVLSLSGSVDFSSDGESGFIIHATLPR
ncbi:MAG: hypothetical protein KBI01_10235 [Oscillospiraceae bacterium]|nr:hypothetical protein [Oscillospiraceae bacterium]